MKYLQIVGLMAIVALFGVTLQGCSVNVIVAPGATLAVDSLNVREEQYSASQYNEADLIPVLVEEYE